MGACGCGIVSLLPPCEILDADLMGVLAVVRTGQAHRTLVGHTAPVTCLQFDEQYIVTGSLDKTIRVSRVFVLHHYGY